MSPLVAGRLRLVVLGFLVLLIQTTFGTDLRTASVAPDLMVLFTICAGLTGGAEAGAWVGFFAGLSFDMFLVSTPVGLSALTYCIIGASVGALRTSVLQERPAMYPVVALAATAAAVLLFVGAGDVFGQNQLVGAGRSWLIRVMIVESIWNALLAIPLGYVYAWAARGSAGAETVGSPLRTRSRTSAT
jgi:rod shape-determining protein MreD